MRLGKLSQFGMGRVLPIKVKIIIPVVAATLLLAGCSSQPSLDSERIVARLQSNVGAVEAFSDMFPEVYWNEICHIEAYDNAVQALWRHGRGDFRGYDVTPRYPVPEDANGILLIDRTRRFIYLIIIPFSDYKHDIRVIRGPICLPKADAFYRTKVVPARNGSYRELTFIDNREE
ncbi:hypothetical protein FHW00_004154 [Ochrobactrum sp. P6BSIII]|uniref:hypothetical protein n=1 Tax=unclassified Ochrobactrum TaxID=239106 RepID=UPI001116AB01|nr:hypothetical protein [Ochrobactrum sp. P6BSIII]